MAASTDAMSNHIVRYRITGKRVVRARAPRYSCPMPVITSIADLKALHRRRTPKMFYDYCESGSWTEQTFRENTTDFDRVRFRQRVAVDMTDRSLATTMLGEPVAMPVALAPVGSLGMQAADGEIQAARAAEPSGAVHALDHVHLLDRGRGGAHGEALLVPALRDAGHGFVDEIIERRRAARCSALVLTLDLQILGQRHKDLKNGLSAPPKPTPREPPRHGRPVGAGPAGMARHRSGGSSATSWVPTRSAVATSRRLMAWTAEQFDPRLDWAKVERIRAKWGRQVRPQGHPRRRDAPPRGPRRRRRHRGLQPRRATARRGALSSIRTLPSIVRAVKGETVDLARSRDPLGPGPCSSARTWAPTSTMIGRAYVYRAGRPGRSGRDARAGVIAREADVTMALCGRRRVRDMTRDTILVPPRLRGRLGGQRLTMARLRQGPPRGGAQRPAASSTCAGSAPCGTCARRSPASTAPPAWTTSWRASTTSPACGGKARPDDLRALDLLRDVDPEWFLHERTVGYVLYVDRFCGTLRDLPARIPTCATWA
jgi:L-lactate dehydrogenase (cytochrome)